MLIILLIVIYLSSISLGLPDSLLGSSWSFMHNEMNVPISYAGIVFMIITGGNIISSFFSEKLIRHLETGILTFISVFMTAVALFGFSISYNFVTICIFAIPLGLGAGAVDAAINNHVALHYKAKYMSWLHCFWGIGATISPIILSDCLQIEGAWRLGYRKISIIQFGLVAILFLSLPLWKKLGRESEQEEEKKSSLRMFEMIKLPGVKSALISCFCYYSVEATTGLWGSTYLVVIKGISEDRAARWISLFYFGITFGRLLSGFISMKLNQHQMIKMGQGILSCGIIVLLLPLANSLLLVGFFLIGLGCAPIYPSLLHETPENFGSKHSQSIMGVQIACACISAAFMPPIFGVIGSYVGYRFFPFYLSVLTVLMIVMVETLYKRVKEKVINRVIDI